MFSFLFQALFSGKSLRFTLQPQGTARNTSQGSALYNDAERGTCGPARSVRSILVQTYCLTVSHHPCRGYLLIGRELIRRLPRTCLHCEFSSLVRQEKGAVEHTP